MKYIASGYDENGKEILGTDKHSFGEYASDNNAIRYMANSAKRMLRYQEGFTNAYSVKLFRYTNFYDDNTFKLVYVWSVTK